MEPKQHPRKVVATSASVVLPSLPVERLIARKGLPLLEIFHLFSQPFWLNPRRIFEILSYFDDLWELISLNFDLFNF